MKRYNADILSEVTGLSLIGATLDVFVTGTETRVTLYADDDQDGATVSQPVPNGTAFYIPDGRYDLRARNGARSRIIPQVDMFDGFEQNRRLEAVENGEPNAPGSLREDLLAPTGAARSGYQAKGEGAVASTVGEVLDRWVWAEDYGLSTAGTPENNAAAIMRAIVAAQGAAHVLGTDGLGAFGPFLAYATGKVQVGPGCFRVAANVIALFKHQGLELIGRGYRGHNLTIRGATELRFVGTGSVNDFAIRARGNGARGLTPRNMDITYEPGWTGDLLDLYSSPGSVPHECYLGTCGIGSNPALPAIDRFQATARSCVRLTYDEFFQPLGLVCSGAKWLIWSDDVREPTAGFSEFGGSTMTLSGFIGYDATEAHFYHSGARSRLDTILVNFGANPITVSPKRAISAANLKGLVMVGGMFQSTDSNTKFTEECVRIAGSSGRISGFTTSVHSKAGTLDGNLAVTDCVINGTDGLTLRGGNVTIGNNTFKCGGKGYRFDGTSQGTYTLAVRLSGGDDFASTCEHSYFAAADSANFDIDLAGYSATFDNSVGKFSVPSNRFSIRGGRNPKGNTAAIIALTTTDTGSEIVASGAVDQVAPLPAAVSGTFICLRKMSEHQLTVTGSIFTGNGGVKGSLTAAPSDRGGRLVFEGYAGVGWFVRERTGTWSEA